MRVKISKWSKLRFKLISMFQTILRTSYQNARTWIFARNSNWNLKTPILIMNWYLITSLNYFKLIFSNKLPIKTPTRSEENGYAHLCPPPKKKCFFETRFLPNLFACMVGCIIRSVLAYHLICQHDKLPLVYLFIYFFFLYEFCVQDISKTESTIMFKFSQDLGHD